MKWISQWRIQVLYKAGRTVWALKLIKTVTKKHQLSHQMFNAIESHVLKDFDLILGTIHKNSDLPLGVSTSLLVTYNLETALQVKKAWQIYFNF